MAALEPVKRHRLNHFIANGFEFSFLCSFRAQCTKTILFCNLYTKLFIFGKLVKKSDRTFNSLVPTKTTLYCEHISFKINSAANVERHFSVISFASKIGLNVVHYILSQFLPFTLICQIHSMEAVHKIIQIKKKSQSNPNRPLSVLF